VDIEKQGGGTEIKKRVGLGNKNRGTLMSKKEGPVLVGGWGEGILFV